MQPDDDDARSRLWWMTENIGEASIERDDRSTFGYGQQTLVFATDKILVARECHVMATVTKDGTNQVRYVLVELDSRHD